MKRRWCSWFNRSQPCDCNQVDNRLPPAPLKPRVDDGVPFGVEIVREPHRLWFHLNLLAKQSQRSVEARVLRGETSIEELLRVTQEDID